MSKFNTRTAIPARGTGPVRTVTTPGVRTHEGASALARDARSELFMLAVTNLVGEETFYETALTRDARFVALVHQVALDDPGWMLRMLRWLRGEANMRSAALVGAAEMIHARLAARAPSIPAYDVPGFDTDRGIERVAVDTVCQRPDEPGELLAYWLGRYGRPVPMPVKRGLGDAARRLYREYGLLKYDTGSHAVRFGDVIDLVHPTPGSPEQNDLFRYALDRRHGRPETPPESLAMVHRQQHVRAAVAAGEVDVLLDGDVLRGSGLTWEDALSLAGDRVSKARLWDALIPTMGIFALARNLRNFDEAGVSDQVAGQVMARFGDPEQVARSRMFPYRWLAAYEQAPSLRWAYPLEQALQASVANIPAMPGRSLVLVDTSSSMTNRPVSKRSTITPVKAAALFGVVLAARGENVDLVGFADSTFAHPVRAGSSVLQETDRFVRRVGEVGHGTRITAALRASYRGHDRVFIMSDMQTMPDVDAYTRNGAAYGVPNQVPDHVPVYGFDLGGGRPTIIDTTRPGRVELGGLNDATFRFVPLIESGRRADWPF